MRTDLPRRLGRALGCALGLAAAPAFAGMTCSFETECYQTEACAASGWELNVDRDTGMMSSVAEDLEIIAIEADGSQIVARGANSVNLLTIGEEFSLFTVHLTGEPTVVTYVGECRAE